MVHLPDKALFLAPMVDCTHPAFRQLVRSLGGCDILFSEMLNSRMLPLETPETSTYMRWVCKDDLVLQLLGCDPAKMQRAAAILDSYAPWGIDINMGCWLKKITCHGWGAAMMRDMDMARKNIEGVRAATARPLSVKIRIGEQPDQAYLDDFVQMVQAAGADYIILHARTVADGLKRRPRWEFIAAAKEKVAVPLIGNGGVETAQDVVRMLHETGCDGVMIGRQALATPWIFREAKALLGGAAVPEQPSLCDVMLQLVDECEEHLPAEFARKRCVSSLQWLCRNLKFGHFMAGRLSATASFDGLRQVITASFAAGIS